ncbi:MAG: hypothetical protein AABX83_02230 [Nanoarchaeota archaeon]
MREYNKGISKAKAEYMQFNFNKPKKGYIFELTNNPGSNKNTNSPISDKPVESSGPDKRANLFTNFVMSLGLMGGVAFLAYGITKLFPEPHYKVEEKILQIRKIYDGDTIQGNDTIELEDGRTIQIKDRQGKLSLIDKLLEKK